MARKHGKKVRVTAVNWDAVKAMRRGQREAQQELLGPGFHSNTHTHRSKKTYTRKAKHKLAQND